MTSRLHPTDARAPQGDFISIAPAVCERLLGEPSSRSSREWRWRSKGSFRLKLDTGTWNDFESGEGGGVLALVMREERLDKAGAMAWLEQQGFLSGRSRIGAYGSGSGKTIARESPYSPANQGSTAMPDRGPKETLRWIRQQILPIADAHDHPIRAWMRRRNLWRDELPLPPSLRWIAADAPVFRRTHSGVGAIAFPLAPVSAWRASYPDIPPPSAVQLVCIDADGERADYENSQGKRVDKPKVRQRQACRMDRRGRPRRQSHGLRGSCGCTGARRKRTRPSDRHPDDPTTASGLERCALGVRLRNAVAGHGRGRRAGSLSGTGCICLSGAGSKARGAVRLRDGSGHRQGRGGRSSRGSAGQHRHRRTAQVRPRT